MHFTSHATGGTNQFNTTADSLLACYWLTSRSSPIEHIVIEADSRLSTGNTETELSSANELDKPLRGSYEFARDEIAATRVAPTSIAAPAVRCGSTTR